MNKLVLVLTSAMCLLGTQMAAGASPVRRFALAAGANFGGAERAVLRYAVSDAENFARVLEEMGGLDAADCIVLQDPGLETFRQAMESLRRKVEAARGEEGRTEVLLYYSGHADEQGLLLGTQRMGYQSLRQALKGIRADVHITVLDACASGTITRLKGGRRYQPFLVDASSDTRGYAFLTSGSADEAAQESDRIGASFFTHYLISGLRGAADVSGDGRVTLNEAYQFAFNETLTRTAESQAGAQHPSYDIKMTGTGDVVMTDLSQMGAGLVLAEELGGRFFIRNADQQLVAELYKPTGRSVELGLEPGHYAIQLEETPGLFAASLELEEGQHRMLRGDDFLPVGREATARRGGAAARETVEFNPGGTVDVGAEGGYTYSFGLFVNQQKRPFRGLQLACLINHARDRAGSQISAVVNSGQQDIEGVQVGGALNAAAGQVDGGQFAGAVNIARGVRGLQGAGAANVTWGPVDGAQFSGAFNVAGPVDGW